MKRGVELDCHGELGCHGEMGCLGELGCHGELGCLGELGCHGEMGCLGELGCHGELGCLGELGCHGELGCLLLQVPTAGLSDSVFVTLFRTAIERAHCGVRKLLRTGEAPTSLTPLFRLWLTVSSVFTGRSRGTS